MEGKKVSGIKIHIVTDTMGLPHGISATTANVGDREGIIETVKTYAQNLSNISKILADGGFTGENFEKAIELLIGAEVEIAKRSELYKFAVMPKRWIVERTFGWLENYRRLWKNCERKIENTVQMTVLAFISLLLMRW